MTTTRRVTLFLAFALILSANFLILGTSAARAQSPVAAIPQFMPIGAWRVEPTGLANIRGLANIKLPCMMMSSYDNGYIVRLSGGDQKLLAMAIDFRQNVFHQGRKYPAIIKVDGAYIQKVTATAFSENALIFNLRKLPNFYQTLQSAGSMELEIEGNVMQFTMGGLNYAFERLESCYSSDGPWVASTSNAMKAQQGAQSSGAPLASVSKWEDKVTPVSARMGSGMKSSARSSLWEAKAGDDMKQTLQGWANRAGVNIDWQAAQGGRVVSDLRVSGGFEDAVKALMAQNAAAMGLEANLKGAHSSSSTASYGAPQRLSPSRASGSSVSRGSAGLVGVGTAKWSAPAGSSLQQVLRAWSRQAGVELAWEANQGFAVKSTVSANGSYEAALQSLLNQFTNDSVRPAAQLNNDPVSGRRMLLVQSTRI